MEEIMKKIESGLAEIKKEQEKLLELENNSKKLQDEAKKIDEERNQISDTESGFYKDISNKYKEKNNEFRQADIERMNEDKYINTLISIKKETILSDIKAKMKYIDENRNVSLDGIDVEKIKEEKEALEKEIKLNDTTKEEFEKMSDSDKQAVRKAKENYLNNKHRLAEINPKVELADALEGKEPKDRFIEIEALLKKINDNFNRDNINKLINEFGKEETVEQPKIESETTIEENIMEPEVKTKVEFNIKPVAETIVKSKVEPTTIENNAKPETKYSIILDIHGNSIRVNDNDKLFYKEELKNKKQIREKYGIGSYFVEDKKFEKLVDYALISALEKIDDKENSLVKSYLKIIRDGKTQSEGVKESIEKINKAVDIEYKFNKEDGKLLNIKEKRIARYAKKMGIASLDGIDEKSTWDKISDKAKMIFSKIKQNKLLGFRKGPDALASGEKTEKTEETQNKNIRSMYKVTEKVKQNIDEVAKKYSEREKEEEKNRAEEVKKIRDEEK